LLKEVKYLRSTRENVEKLKEEKAAVDNQLQSMQDLREKLASAEIEVVKLRAEKKRWTGFLEHQDETGIDSPYELSKTLATERLELALLKEKSGLESAKQKGLEEHIRQLEIQVLLSQRLAI
jgi:FtsZ-binding cell division protein ZapB